MNKTKNCPVCNSLNVDIFLNRPCVPVHQNLVLGDKNSAIEITRGDLDLAICLDCQFVFNQGFSEEKMRYGSTYDNTQDISPFFEDYKSNLINHLVSEHDVKNKCIVEIGCGKGSFLRSLVENSEWNNIAYGFDPSYVGPSKMFDGRLNFKKQFFDSSIIDNIKIDLIVCRHVIEHIPNPVKFLKTIRQSLDDESKVWIFFETPSVEWIFHNNVIYDFFYEHCSYFSKQSMRIAFELSGFKVEKVETVFEGQYLWMEATIADKTSAPKIVNSYDSLIELAKKFGQNEQDLTKSWKKKVTKIIKESENNKVAVWGAGAKGVTFVNLIDPNLKLIEYVIDINPNKVGNFIPGTGHPIIGTNNLINSQISHIIIMNPNYYQEIKNILKKSNLANINLLAY